VGHQIADESIRTMLDLEVPNLHERDLDRVIAYGHTWSPRLELTPPIPMLHGHAVAIDMALSLTLAAERNYISAHDRDRVLTLMSRLGLALDSPYLTPALLHTATESILQTRDGCLRAAMPRPLGSCAFVNDLSPAELEHGLARHKQLCARLPRAGDGIDMFTAQPAEQAA
jgi:3-dehydroquinate synthase